MKERKYVWIVGGDISSKKAYHHPAQIRLLAKKYGFSIFDEIYTKTDLIVFSTKEKGFCAEKYEVV